MLNGCGEVVGINTAILGSGQNLGFAVPINLVKQFLPQLLEHGKIIRPWLGVSGRLIGDELGEIFRMKLAPGYLVETVEPGSPAHEAGLHGGGLQACIAGEEILLGGDIIVGANEKPITDNDSLAAFFNSLKVGDVVKLKVLRQEEVLTKSVNIVERPILPGILTGNK